MATVYRFSNQSIKDTIEFHYNNALGVAQLNIKQPNSLPAVVQGLRQERSV